MMPACQWRNRTQICVQILCCPKALVRRYVQIVLSRVTTAIQQPQTSAIAIRSRVQTVTCAFLGLFIMEVQLWNLT